MSYDPSQQALIDNLEGFVLADAGPGTGKTHTVIGRSIAILRRCIQEKGQRMAMLTFTRNAAAEMQERLVGGITSLFENGEIDDDMFKKMSSAARTTFVGTFDSFCLNIVKKAPWQVSRFFRFGQQLTSGAQVCESETLNTMYFRRFLDRWIETNGGEPVYGDIPAVISGGSDGLYEVINRLMCMGIVPLRSGGWFGGTPRGTSDDSGPAGEPEELRGSPQELEVQIAQLIGEKDFRKKLVNSSDSLLVDGLTAEQLGAEQAHIQAFQDRDVLLRTIHDIFYSYMEKSVDDGRLTFGLTACFAFVILYSNKEVRQDVAFDYLTVDEFQDTNTLQLMIAMMVLRKPNMCAVGDWRQGIYGFRYVSVENILDFAGRLRALRRVLNDDGNLRVPYQVPQSSDDIALLPLKVSYRSSKAVIHNSYLALTLKASDRKVPRQSIDQAEAEGILSEEISSAMEKSYGEHTHVVKVAVTGGHAEEAAEAVRRAFDYIQNHEVFDRQIDGFRPARWSDIAVLCRTTLGCRRVYNAMQEAGVPAYLQGDLEIMSSAEAKILLAWMKYVENSSDSRGIVPILGYMGYSAAEIREMLPYHGSPGTGVPKAVLLNRKVLAGKTRRISDFIATVYQFHGIGNDISQAVAKTVTDAYGRSLMTLSEIIVMMEKDITSDTRYQVDGSPESNAVTIQTVHGSKGLEYPVVIIPFMDPNVFPATKGDRGTFRYSRMSGIRCIRTVVRAPEGYMEDTQCWKGKTAVSAIPPEYDEERRLLFVAISRAKQYVTLIAGSTQSKFFKALGCDESGQLSGDIPRISGQAAELPDPPEIPAFGRSRPITMPVHQIMGSGGADDWELEDTRTGRGMNYGSRVHRIAQMMADGQEPDPADRDRFPEIAEIRRFLSARPEGAVFTEVPCALHLDVRGRRFALNGSIDLLVVSDDRVFIYDWKTDVTTKFSEDYRIQLSVYYHCVLRQYPGRKVEAAIIWLSSENPGVVKISPLPLEDISGLAQDSLRARGIRRLLCFVEIARSETSCGDRPDRRQMLNVRSQQIIFASSKGLSQPNGLG